MLDEFRPRLRDTVRVRMRSDGSAGAWDTRTGRALEVAADEAPLLAAVDGARSVAAIAELHAKEKGFVPFTALRDLLQGLARQDLLANAPWEIAQEGLAVRRRRNERFADALIATFPLPAAKIVCPLVALAAVAAAILLVTRLTEATSSGWDVLLAYAGAAIALTTRGFFRAAAASLFGQPPVRLRLALCFGVLHLEPDGGSLALLDRRPRAIAHFAALAGICLGLVGSEPGLFAGALAVLLGDLIPFEPTSTGKLLAIASGRVDLREHARAYLTRRLLSRAAARQLFDGEGSLIMSLLASLAWFTLLIRVLLQYGLLAVLQLWFIAAGASTGGAERVLALVGSVALIVSMPVALGALVWALVRAGLSVRPARARAQGRVTNAALQSKDLESIPAFAHLTGEQLDKIAAAVKEVSFHPGERVVRQGDPGDCFYAVRCGAVAVEHELPSGLTREVARLGPGDCFGETALLENAPRSATVKALTEVSLASLSRADFDAVVKALGGADVTRLLRAAAALHKSSFFSRLPTERLSALALKLTPREVKAGTLLVKAGEAGHEFFLIATGSVEVLSPEGARVAELRPGDHFGEVALLRDVPRVATVRAIEDATVLVLAKDAFLKAMSADLGVSSGIESLAAERVKGATA